MAYINTEHLFKCETCRRYKGGKCLAWCESGECYSLDMTKIPTADVVEVVRCKDCKNAYINSFSAQSGIAVCRFWTNRLNGEQAIVQQDDFCSYAERKCEADHPTEKGGVEK